MPMVLRTALLSSLVLLGACSPRDAATDGPPPDSKATQAMTPAPRVPGSLGLDAAGSRLSFVSIKNNTVAEVHTFDTLRGVVDPQGKVRLEIDLDSVRTGIELRDQRMRELLFETHRFHTAVITLDTDLEAVRALAPGAHRIVPTQAVLDLHGVQNRVPAELRITRVDASTWLVSSERPVIVSATHFGLINGVEALRRVVGLQSIGSGVPVSFTLRWTSDDAHAPASPEP